MGAIFDNQVYHVPTPFEMLGTNIAILEMYNILVAIRVWGNVWRCKTIEIFCDNEAVVTVLNTGKTRKVESAKLDISLKFTHV